MSDPQQQSAEQPNDAAPASPPTESHTPRQRLLGWLVGLGALALPLVIVFCFLSRYSITEELVLSSESEKPITFVAFSPDDKLIAAGSEDSTVYLWDRQTGDEVAKLKEHSGRINSLAFSQDGSKLLVGDMVTTRLWDLKTKKEILRLNHAKSVVFNVAFAKDDRDFVTTSKLEPFIRMWDSNSGRSLAAVAGTVGLLAPSIIARLPNSGALQRRSVQYTGLIRTFHGHIPFVTCVVFSSDGSRLLSAGGESAKLWDVASGKLLQTFEDPSGRIAWVAFSPDDNRFISTGADHVIRLWDLKTKKVIREFRGHRRPVVSAAFSPGGRYFASGSLGRLVRKDDDSGAVIIEKRNLRVWDLNTGGECFHVAADPGPIQCLAFSRDGRHLVSAGVDGKVRLWRMP